MEKNTADSQEQIFQIDTLEILKLLFSKWKLILKWAVIFIVLGLIVALTTPKQYTSKVVIYPQTTSSTGLSRLGGLAAMAGVNLGASAGGADIPPTLYTNVISSTPFRKELLNTQVKTSNGESVTLTDYLFEHQKGSLIGFVKRYTIGLPGVIIGAFKSDEAEVQTVAAQDSLYRISQDELALFEFLNSTMLLEYDDMNGQVKVQTTLQDPVVSAQITEKAQELLEGYVVDFKIKKAEGELTFVQQRYDEAKEDYMKKQSALGSLTDSNQNFVSSVVKNRLERARSEFNLASSVYSELANQLEMAKLTVKKNTPIFTVIEPVTVPVEESSPNKKLILIGFAFLGIIASVGYLLFKRYYPEVKALLSK